MHMSLSRLRSFAALGLPLVVGCGRYVASNVATADSLFAKKQYSEAITAYDKASRFDPNNPHIVKQLGFAHTALGHRDLAYTFLQKAQAVDSNAIDVRLALGALYLRAARDTDALGEANAILRRQPENAEALNLRAAVHLERNPDEAIRDFRKLEQAAPKSSRPSYSIGAILLAKGDTAGAIREFEQSLTLAPADVDPLQKLVSIDLARKRPDAALDLVKRQMSTTGESAPLHVLLGSVYMARGDAQSAAGEYKKGISQDPKYAEAYTKLAEFYQSTGKPDSAMATASQAIRADSMNLGARMVLGVVYQTRGDMANAERHYEAALAVNPRFAGAANNLAWILADRNSDLERAVRLAELARAGDPNNPEIADTYGWILFKRGEYPMAVAQLRASAAKLPDDAAIAFHLGMASLRAGDTTGAKAALKRAADSKQGVPEKAEAQRALSAIK
jgi:tetratricopeptide (TPR) repeat protein